MKMVQYNIIEKRALESSKNRVRYHYEQDAIRKLGLEFVKRFGRKKIQLIYENIKTGKYEYYYDRPIFDLDTQYQYRYIGERLVYEIDTEDLCIMQFDSIGNNLFEVE